MLKGIWGDWYGANTAGLTAFAIVYVIGALGWGIEGCIAGYSTSMVYVIEALKGQYGNFRALEKNAVISALMTAEANGLLEETRFDMDNSGNLRVFYHANEDGAATINKYID